MVTIFIKKQQPSIQEAASTNNQLGKVYKDCDICPTMVEIPSGRFQMGSNERNDEKPIHTVNIKQFSLSQTEVTKGEFATFVNALGYKTEAETGDGCNVYDGSWQKKSDANWRNANFNQTDNSPVVCVSWNDSKEYISWLNNFTGNNYRLPSESEWEYSARAGSNSKYNWGNSIGINNANCGSECGDSYSNTSPVKSFRANNFGLYDMHGNVWEWVEDKWHGNYNGAPSDGSAWTSGSNTNNGVMRGGSWYSTASYLRSAASYSDKPTARFHTTGFRIAQDD